MADEQKAPLTFEEWKKVWYGELFENHDRRDYAAHVAKIAWTCRQSEIDALTERLASAEKERDEELRAKVEAAVEVSNRISAQFLVGSRGASVIIKSNTAMHNLADELRTVLQ